MSVSTTEPISIPIADEILLAYARDDGSRVVELVEASPLEAWFGIPVERMHAILAALPPEATTTSATIRALRLLLNSTAEIIPPADPQAPFLTNDLKQLGETAAATFDHRLRGAVRAAERIARRQEMVLNANALFDKTAGWSTFMGVQAGIGSMLTGDFTGALAALAAARNTAPPVSLTSLLRDAYVKSALIHALYGDPRTARQHLDLAAALPLTASWVEAVVAAHAEIAEALLSAYDDLGDAIERLERIPMFLSGELWPFHLAAAFRTYWSAARVKEGVQSVENLSQSAPAHARSEGLPGSILPHVRAAAALRDGRAARARALLEEADAELITTRLLLAAADIADGELDAAIRRLAGARAETEGLRQLETVRVSMLAWALLRRGDRDQAAELVADLAALPGGLQRTEIALFPSEVNAFAAAAVEAWPEWSDGSGEHAVAPVRPKLTSRERDVLALLATDMSRTEIAESLFVSLNTLKTQQRSLFRKLHASSRTEAVLEAHRLGLL